MRKKIGFLKKAIAKIDGYFSRKGEKLVSARLTPEQVAEFNGVEVKKAAPAKKTVATKKAAPAKKKAAATAPVVYAVTEEAAAAVDETMEAAVEAVAPAVVVTEEEAVVQKAAD